MLFDLTSDKVRLTRAELAELRKRAARKGCAINQVNDNDEALDALLKALPRGIAEDLLQLLKTGRSPLTESRSLGHFKKLISED